MADYLHTSRRELLKGAPLAAISMTSGGSALASESVNQTQIMVLFRQWEAHRRDGEDENLVPEEAIDAHLDAVGAIERKMLNIPSTSAADFAAKVCAYTCFGLFNLSEEYAPEIWAEARQLLADV